jgi:DNA-binding phage protein
MRSSVYAYLSARDEDEPKLSTILKLAKALKVASCELLQEFDGLT